MSTLRDTPPSIQPVKVLLVDGYPIVRLGLEYLISGFPGFLVAATAGNQRDALSVMQSAPVDLVVTSLAIGPRDEGFRFLKESRCAWPHIPILVLSGQPENQSAVRAFQCGAQGFIAKDSRPEEILKALRTVSSGDPYFTSQVGSLIVDTLRESSTELVA